MTLTILYICWLIIIGLIFTAIGRWYIRRALR